VQRFRDLDDFAVVTDPGRVLEGRPPLLAIPAQPLIGVGPVGQPFRALRLTCRRIRCEPAAGRRGGREQPAAESGLGPGTGLFVCAPQLVGGEQPQQVVEPVSALADELDEPEFDQLVQAFLDVERVGVHEHRDQRHIEHEPVAEAEVPEQVRGERVEVVVGQPERGLGREIPGDQRP
jgi:hypothetical protein